MDYSFEGSPSFFYISHIYIYIYIYIVGANTIVMEITQREIE